jgi:hypothetical protein
MMRALPLVALLACSSMEAPPPVAQAKVVKPHFENHWGTVAEDDEGQTWAHPDQVPMGQMPRRLEVEHLRQSIPRLFGGIQWVNDQEQPMWDVLSRTLGEADFLEVTEHNTDPSPLFAKFMDDMAAQVCKKALDRDAGNSDEQTRLVLRHANDVAANLRWLRLKMHGVLVSPDNDGPISQYHEMHRQIVASDGLGQAWLGVCMAMITSPEFMTY